MAMKPGDKVWVYSQISGDKIMECKVVDRPDGDAVFAYDIIGQYRQRPYIGLKCEAFPTREALCEHYRKIFE